MEITSALVCQRAAGRNDKSKTSPSPLLWRRHRAKLKLLGARQKSRRLCATSIEPRVDRTPGRMSGSEFPLGTPSKRTRTDTRNEAARQFISLDRR
jgi:hypothetical protein